jgi:uncharacterized protein YdeI (YjbR/CyaY-like superfamily)
VTTGEPDDLVLPDEAAWRRWLASHHDDTGAAWLVLARKGTREPTSLTYDDALDHALCFGWIDGQRRSRDEATFRQRFTPRGRRSPWSVRNVARATSLIEQGRMTAAGLDEVERAQADGRWAAAYHGSATIDVPDDLVAALAASPAALRMFGILTSQNRYAILYRIGSAKRAETRATRIESFVAMLAEGRTVYPQRASLDD